MPEVKALLTQSLFQRLWFTDIPKRQLQLEYRLSGSVIPFFNETVYNAAHGLQPILMDPERRERPLPAGLSIPSPIVIVDSSAVSKKPGEGEETQVLQRGYSNQTEAETIVEMVEQLVRCVPGTVATSVGISAPYKMQILLIQNLMRARTPWPPGFKVDQVLIATTDAFQGSEREFMFVSTVRSSYHGLKFAASLRRINVILSRGSVVTFVISNSRVFGRGDRRLLEQKHKPDTREGLEALQRLFKWQSELDNVYTLDTWRRVFTLGQPPVQVNLTEKGPIDAGKRWNELYYRSWRISILRKWHLDKEWVSMEQIDNDWQQFRVVFRIANVRRILMDTLAYCTQLWIDNIVEKMGGPNPTRTVRDNNTVLTVQNSEVPVKGWPHLSYQRYPLLLLTILLNEEPRSKGCGMYKRNTTMLGIERGQRGEVELEERSESEEWHKVSERSKRSMMGLTVLTALGLGILDLEAELSKGVQESQKERNGHSIEDGQIVCIRLEHLRGLWERNDRTHWDRMSSYSDCTERPWETDRCHLDFTVSYGDKELRMKVQHLQWQMILYRYKVDQQVKEQATKVKTSLILIKLMNYLNHTRVHKEFAQCPRTFKQGQTREPRRWKYWKRRWQQIVLHVIRTWTLEQRTKVHLLQKDARWKDQIRRHPWYRCIPLITWLVTWEVGLVYLPTSSGKESWRDWPNPESSVSANTGVAENDLTWKDWSEKCGNRMRTKGIGFYEGEYIDTWWSHLHIVNKREVLKWLLYDRSDCRWHHSTGSWVYYLGKIPGLRNHAPRTILHSRERPSYYESTVSWKGKDRSPTDREPDEGKRRIDLLIPEQHWNQQCQEIAKIQTYCTQLWPRIPVKGPGCNSLGNSTWLTRSKEDALEEQRKLCERIARHKVGERRNGQFARSDSTYIISPYARQEHNLPLFPDHEANMALPGAGEPKGWGYGIQIMNPGLFIRMGQEPVWTWLNVGLTPSLLQMSPPGFLSGPSSASEVVYSQPGDSACTQSQIRLRLRDLSRAHDVTQGIAVAKKFENMPKLLGTEVLNQIGPLNHPAP